MTIANRLDGERIMITAAGQGIGLAKAEAFVRKGAALLLIHLDVASIEVAIRQVQDEIG